MTNQDSPLHAFVAQQRRRELAEQWVAAFIEMCAADPHDTQAIIASIERMNVYEGLRQEVNRHETRATTARIGLEQARQVALGAQRDWIGITDTFVPDWVTPYREIVAIIDEALEDSQP